MSTNKDDILNNILHQYMQKDTNPLKQKDGINNGWKFKTLILTQRTPHNNYKLTQSCFHLSLLPLDLIYNKTCMLFISLSSRFEP